MSAVNFNEDPFYSVKDSVNSQIERIKIKYDKFMDLLHAVDTASSNEFKELRKTLSKDLRTVSQDVKGLLGALEMVEKKRNKFPHITDQELSSRKDFINEANDSINELKIGMDSPIVRRKLEADERAKKYTDKGGNTFSAIEQENSRFIDEQQHTTHNILLQQDVELTSLGSAVDKLGEIGRDVGLELREQNMMLDKLEQDVDDVNTKMNFVMASLGRLLKTKDGCTIWTIVILFLILCILVALVIWT